MDNHLDLLLTDKVKAILEEILDEYDYTYEFSIEMAIQLLHFCLIQKNKGWNIAAYKEEADEVFHFREIIFPHEKGFEEAEYESPYPELDVTEEEVEEEDEDEDNWLDIQWKQ